MLSDYKTQNHVINWDEATILDRESDRTTRWIRGAVNNRDESQSCEYTLCLKKVTTFKLSVTLSNVNRFTKFLHFWKAREICYKTHSNYLPHLKHVATLLWKIKNANFLQIFSTPGRKCKQIQF